MRGKTLALLARLPGGNACDTRQYGASQSGVLCSPCILIRRREWLLPRLSLMALHHHLPLWVGLGWLYCSSWQAAHANGDLCV